MAGSSILNSVFVAVVFVILSVAAPVSAQAFESAMAPAPSIVTGAAFSTPISGFAVFFSVLLSLLALMKH